MAAAVQGTCHDTWVFSFQRATRQSQAANAAKEMVMWLPGCRLLQQLSSIEVVHDDVEQYQKEDEKGSTYHGIESADHNTHQAAPFCCMAATL